MKQKIEPINDNEVLWIKEQLENAEKFVAAFSPADSGSRTLAALDRAFAAWLDSGAAVAEINAIINCVGIAFGQALVDGLGLKWVIATDEHGTDLAVYGLPNRGDVLVYPANFVAKRWERRETNFLQEAYRQVAEDVRAITRQWQASQ
jgi:uncharacterized protein DUF3806